MKKFFVGVVAGVMMMGLAVGNFGQYMREGDGGMVVYADDDEDTGEAGDGTSDSEEDPGTNYVSNSGCAEGEIKTAILGGTSGCYEIGDNGAAIFALLARVLTILTYGVGSLGVLGIVISGVQYTLSAGDVAKMTKAKQRIIEVVIGLVCWGLLYSFLEWIIPGGIL